MPLIKCPVCANDVSDQAAVCPKCGHPLQPRTPSLAPGSLDELIRQKLLADGKIAAIKLYRERTAVGLKEAKDAVELIEATLPPGSARKGGGCLGLVLGLLVILGFAAVLFVR
jgi:hypothetical protein